MNAIRTCLQWCVDHDGECLGDHQSILASCIEALKNAPSLQEQADDELRMRLDHPSRVTDAMVDRFLSWKLPQDFSPDSGIVFKPHPHPNAWPIGTNLLTAVQARSMLEHVLKGDTPPSSIEPKTANPERRSSLEHSEVKHDGNKERSGEVDREGGGSADIARGAAVVAGRTERGSREAGRESDREGRVTGDGASAPSATEAFTRSDQAELHYWRSCNADIMHRKDMVDGLSHAERIGELRLRARADDTGQKP